MHLLADRRETIVLDFGDRDPAKDLRNELSAVCADKGFVWTGSD